MNEYSTTYLAYRKTELNLYYVVNEWILKIVKRRSLNDSSFLKGIKDENNRH
jgi:hypothetical protein